jgi:hypothetical protein
MTLALKQMGGPPQYVGASVFVWVAAAAPVALSCVVCRLLLSVVASSSLVNFPRRHPCWLSLPFVCVLSSHYLLPLHPQSWGECPETDDSAGVDHESSGWMVANTSVQLCLVCLPHELGCIPTNAASTFPFQFIVFVLFSCHLPSSGYLDYLKDIVLRSLVVVLLLQTPRSSPSLVHIKSCNVVHSIAHSTKLTDLILFSFLDTDLT